MRGIRGMIMAAQAPTSEIVGIGGDGVAEIIIPTSVPTSLYLSDSGLRVEFYANPNINVRYDNPYMFTYTSLAIGINGTTTDDGYNYIRTYRIGYANTNLSYGVPSNASDYHKMVSEYPTCTSYLNDGSVYAQYTYPSWLGTTPLGGDLVLYPKHYISRMYMPNYFDLVAAEDNGALGFRDTFTNTFYGQTNESGTLTALYNTDILGGGYKCISIKRLKADSSVERRAA